LEFAPVVERDARTSHAATRERADAGSNAHGPPGGVIPCDLHFARVQTRARLYAQPAHRVPNRTRAADGSTRPVERGQGALAGRLDGPDPEPVEFGTHHVVVSGESLPPSPTASGRAGFEGSNLLRMSLHPSEASHGASVQEMGAAAAT
jgi:hypothetical protein